MKNLSKFLSKPQNAAIMCFLLGVTVITIMFIFSLENDKTKQYYNTYMHASSKVSKIEYELYTRIRLNQALSAFVEQVPNITQTNFEEFVLSLIRDDGGIISSMSFEDHLTIIFIAPFDFNKKALGLDLTIKPDRATFLKKCIETKKVYVEGPYELEQGNMGIVAYTPIYMMDTISGQAKAVGVTDVVILWEKFLGVTGLDKEDNFIDISIRGENGTGESGPVFYGDSTIFSKENVIKIPITLPIGEWVFAAYPKGGYDAINIHPAIIISYIFTFLFSLIIYFVLKYKDKNKSVD
jgi:sensor domain CHASE-containing protein